jgi:hypothetical protein
MDVPSGSVLFRRTAPDMTRHGNPDEPVVNMELPSEQTNDARSDAPAKMGVAEEMAVAPDIDAPPAAAKVANLTELSPPLVRHMVARDNMSQSPLRRDT